MPSEAITDITEGSQFPAALAEKQGPGRRSAMTLTPAAASELAFVGCRSGMVLEDGVTCSGRIDGSTRSAAAAVSLTAGSSSSTRGASGVSLLTVEAAGSGGGALEEDTAAAGASVAGTSVANTTAAVTLEEGVTAGAASPEVGSGMQAGVATLAAGCVVTFSIAGALEIGVTFSGVGS